MMFLPRGRILGDPRDWWNIWYLGRL